LQEWFCDAHKAPPAIPQIEKLDVHKELTLSAAADPMKLRSRRGLCSLLTIPLINRFPMKELAPVLPEGSVHSPWVNVGDSCFRGARAPASQRQ
jgi:hypothetical protein